MSENPIKNNNKFKKTLSVILVIVAIIYNVSPVDLIVDITPFIGLADDIFLIFAAFINLYLKWRKK